jgi:hypothetical protein
MTESIIRNESAYSRPYLKLLLRDQLVPEWSRMKKKNIGPHVQFFTQLHVIWVRCNKAEAELRQEITNGR